jgi:cold shock CspA family protein
VAAPIDLSQVFGLQQGEVTTFDDQVGAGRVTAASGASWPFHCTRIAGGSRTIPVGTPVTFVVSPGPVGLEAVEVSPA